MTSKLIAKQEIPLTAKQFLIELSEFQTVSDFENVTRFFKDGDVDRKFFGISMAKSKKV